MMAWTLTVDQLEMFYTLCYELGATTEEQKTAVLQTMAESGQVQSLVRTSMEKEEYIDHLKKHFGNVLVVKPQESNNNG